MAAQVTPGDRMKGMTQEIKADDVLGDNFAFSSWGEDIVMCDEHKCGYKSPKCPQCIGTVSDVSTAFCWPFVVANGCRGVRGYKCKKCETCTKLGGFTLCCAFASAFPPDASVPCGCALCGCCNPKDVTLGGLGMDFKEDTVCHNVICCSHYALFTKFPKCCGVHSSGETCCFTFVEHTGCAPTEHMHIERREMCCENIQFTECAKPCWPFCMYCDGPICC